MTDTPKSGFRAALAHSNPALKKAMGNSREKRASAMSLRFMRAACGFSQEEMCETLGIDLEILDRLESATGKLRRDDEEIVTKYATTCLRHLVANGSDEIQANSRLLP